jgi:sulfatase maturation enzyme AslB (radical SAM superfamily)
VALCSAWRRGWIRTACGMISPGLLQMHSASAGYRLSPFIIHVNGEDVRDIRSGAQFRLAAEQQSAARALSQLPPPVSAGDAVAALRRASLAEDVFQDLVQREIVMDSAADALRQFFPRHAHIETCTHCNARCPFCPASEHKVAARTMDLGVYSIIVRKLARAGLASVSLNAYNEPLLDRFFRERVQILSDWGLKLRLSTNATLLFPRVSELLRSLGVVEQIIVNLPTLDLGEYRQMMGVPMSRALLENLEAALKLSLPVVFCVNGLYPSTYRQQQRIVEFFAAKGLPVRSFTNITHDRADLVRSKHNRVPLRKV